MVSKKLWRTAGYITISLGFYMLYKGGDFNNQFDRNDDVIDAEFEVVE